MEQITNTFEIPACNLETLEQKIKKLNRKALKLNCAPITLETISTFEKTPVSNSQDMNDYYFYHDITTTYHQIKLSGISPIIAGYELIASCEAMENGTLIKTIPGKTYPELYYSTNKRHIQINTKNIHIYTDNGNMVITDIILNPEIAKQWELIRVV